MTLYEDEEWVSFYEEEGWTRHELTERFGKLDNYIPRPDLFVGKTIERIESYEMVREDEEQVETIIELTFTDGTEIKLIATDTISERYCAVIRYETGS